ncbi:family 20 glycosylhydrolase [Silvibacterium acidisoli]|uniref:family 20 glycosylhydrolase n=1 Tax=Acidobacteriaceae bacterium ZG23-2 TaxID=2883246 RepID=UPI00406D4BE6
MKSFLTRSINRRKFLVSSGLAIAAAAAPKLHAATGTKQPVRGIMVDAGRTPETMEYYHRVLDFCSEWQINTLHFRLTDDQGSAMRFTTVPGLMMHRNAFTADELHDLVLYGQKNGVDIIPEVESFGHTGFITLSKTYGHLLDADPDGSKEFSGLCPVHPETLPLFEKLYKEVAAIFPSVYFHGGCDEVNWGGSELSKKALAQKSRAQIWGEYVNALNKIARGLHKEFIVWGDFILHKEPEILSHLDKNIVLHDWNYSDNNAVKIEETRRKIRENGSRALGAPALHCWGWGARVGTEQLRNIDAFADSYYNNGDEGTLGVILTNWLPSRYIQNSIWDGFAYAAVAFNMGTATAQTSGLRRFVEKHYDAEWNEDWAEAFRIVYDDAPAAKRRGTESWMKWPLAAPWSSDEELRAALAQPPLGENPFTRMRSSLAKVQLQVRKNHADFMAFSLCAEYLERMYWRDQVLHQVTDAESSKLLVADIADGDQGLAAALQEDWKSGRFPGDESLTAPIAEFSLKDQVVFAWMKATAYSASLAAQPERFYQLLQSK